MADVKACYAIQKRTEPPKQAIPLISPNQEAFLLSLMEQTGTGIDQDVGSLDRAQASEWIGKLLEKKESMPKKENAARDLPANVLGDQVPRGRYTVVFRRHDEDGNHVPGEDRITLRFREPNMGRWKGTQLVEYLAGPNNENDYVRCGNWTEGGYRIWNRFKDDGRVNEGVRFMAGADDGSRREAGHVYSLASGNCWRCGRTLTVPASINRGLGPECASIVGG